MKIKINKYTFNKTTKQITFSDYSKINLDGILLITNVTSNVIIYNFANPLLGGTVSNNVLTLTYNTSTMNNTDNLQIFYEDGLLPPTKEAQESELETLKQLFAKIPRLTTLPSNDALRVYTDNSTLYNYEYLNTSSSAKTMIFEGPVQTQLLATVQRGLIGF